MPNYKIAYLWFLKPKLAFIRITESTNESSSNWDYYLPEVTRYAADFSMEIKTKWAYQKESTCDVSCVGR